MGLLKIWKEYSNGKTKNDNGKDKERYTYVWFYSRITNGRTDCTAKFFDPTGSFTWYLIEMDEEQDLAYGFVTSSFDPSGEFGPFSINELKGLELSYGLYIERDKNFKPMNLKELYDKVQNGVHV